MKKIGRIILGWWYWITNQNNELARKRLAHCLYCPFREGLICGECGCNLQAKTRLPEEECPKKIW